MSVGDEYEEGKLALMRASMTLTEWIDEVMADITPEWLAGNIADPVAVLELAATEYIADRLEAVPRFFSVADVFGSLVAYEAKSRMQKARDDYEEQYGRRL